MNTNHIKSYAPQARRDFIAAVTRQATKYGLSASSIEPVSISGDVALIAGQAFPKSIAEARAALVRRVEQQGFQVVIEQLAYSWFNRLCAIRYMELHDYLGHGRRVLSHPDHVDGFQLLDECLGVDMPGLDKTRVRELKLDGGKDELLYRELLLGQCHALHQAMPFLFEPVDDETELLLPDNLTKTDSLIRELVTNIPEEDWANIEIIGWLYQFYISEKKDQVIGKVVKSEDIPAATQLFTPNWIVKYMVQNSLGAQWLATYPDSTLKAQMEYYIEPAEQTDEVNAQLKAITPTSLDPEALTLIDPASGSGHILVEAYELFKAIYLERGYRQRDVPQLILEKNLFGLDIDERAAQLTGFALMMKGRADDRRLFERGVKLNVMALVDSAGFDADGLVNGVELEDYGLKPEDLTELKDLFEHATTFGSLIQVPEGLTSSLPVLKKLSEATSQDLFVSEALKQLESLVQQAELLAAQYDAVVANPPYMGSGGMNKLTKKFAKSSFPNASNDLFACFIERGYALAKNSGRVAMVTMQSWMFLSSYKKMREFMLHTKTITTMAQIGYNSFPSMNSKVAQAVVFCLMNERIGKFVGNFVNLNAAPQSADKESVFLRRDPMIEFEVAIDEFSKIPGSPVAYWLGDRMRMVFEEAASLRDFCRARLGLFTGNNDLYIRYWFEQDYESFVTHDRVPLRSRWFPYNKGGSARKWSNNSLLSINWAKDGADVRKTGTLAGEDCYFKEGITWGGLTSYLVTFRHSKPGYIFDSNKGPMMFPSTEQLPFILGYLNSKIVAEALGALNPTLSTQNGDIDRLPFLGVQNIGSEQLISAGASKLLTTSERDWNSYEVSWDFQSFPLLTASFSDHAFTLESSYTAWITQNRDTIKEMQRLEEQNNRLFIDAYGLADELTPDVPIEQITLTVNPAYRYGGKLTEEEQWTRFREDTIEELVSYAIGCMMGRYSLDAPGLIYAHSGNNDFDPWSYTSFQADDDGIVPLTDNEWFVDDATQRLMAFVAVAFPDGAGAQNLEDNLNFLADNLSPKKSESSRETIRRYLSDSFFKKHLQTYKNRPIYWLFSSGKTKAFQCLVYLHRYNEGTLSRMRTDYVIPLTSKLASHVATLEQEKDASSATTDIKRLEKEITRLHKQQAELSTFDEKLRHYADQRIALDLDDGVKVNYGKFGDLLAEVKAVTGSKPGANE
ncbi:BREX-1 system adenine-specific DNA-methyltransferase PglX [Pseudomonadales bacterium]|nr:BREX-1 system adenine-specific DNA-methyltransferase PglX [Pseudomonadales bacterium]